ncbi:hypothetical protein [Actinoplanes ianthinogenes]|uniref:hypothetical protein n=1 Tax=Actinoplanes ianthinogenes TaxID=122358 RepID=UPI001BB3D698|nr:hypothetical protein [Actinoplanes ianthinogenes]
MRAGLLLTVAALAGCGTAPPAPPAQPTAGVSVPSMSATTSAAVTAPRPSRQVSGGWEITVYYTAVERFHSGEPTRVTGCPKLDCAHGDDDLGTYPADFVQAVTDEGTGRTTAGQYLNWSYDVGFWLDSAPRDTDGDRLTPFVSAAADPSVLPHGTRFRIAACGTQDDGSAPPATICATLRDAAWLITDEFTPGLGGSHHIDAYIGPETGPGFTDSPWYLTLTGAGITVD